MIGKRIKKRYSYFLFAVLLGLGAFWVVKYFSDLNSSQELNEVKSTADEPSSDLAEYVAYQDGLILESKGKYSDDIRTILERGELLVGVLSEENEPFVIKERNGEFRGYCVDFARCLADKLGVRLTIDNSAETYDDLIRMAHDKKVDIALGNLGKTEHRATAAALTNSYIDIHFSLMVNRLFEAKNEIDGNIIYFLRNNKFTIGAIGSYLRSAKELFPKCQVVPYSSPHKMLEAVQKGEVDAIIDAETFIEMEMNKNPELYVDCASYMIVDKTEKICVAVPIESKQLFEWINVCIETSNDYNSATIEDVKKAYPEYFKEK